MTSLATLTLKPRADKRAAQGHPWIYSNEIEMSPALTALTPGTPVEVQGPGGSLGLAFFNPRPLIAARLLGAVTDLSVKEIIGMRIDAALTLRERLFPEPFYRLVHAEGDSLPGLIIDRYGDVLVVQANVAGMDRNLEAIAAHLVARLNPAAIIARNDSPSRDLEGLTREVRLLHGTLSGPVEVLENGVRYRADVGEGQKTGWFYDHRQTRAHMAALTQGARVLDLYSHTGAFGILCAVQGAESVAAVDRSAPALALAKAAAEGAGVAERMSFHKGDAFAALEHFARTGTVFDAIIADPPAFVKSRKDLKSGIKGYRKLARLCAPVLAPGGVLLSASCSHLVDTESFRTQTVRGLADASRTGRILRSGGAGPDHPVHLHLPETAYLKTLTLHLD